MARTCLLVSCWPPPVGFVQCVGRVGGRLSRARRGIRARSGKRNPRGRGSGVGSWRTFLCFLSFETSARILRDGLIGDCHDRSWQSRCALGRARGRYMSTDVDAQGSQLIQPHQRHGLGRAGEDRAGSDMICNPKKTSLDRKPGTLSLNVFCSSRSHRMNPMVTPREHMCMLGDLAGGPKRRRPSPPALGTSVTRKGNSKRGGQ